MCYSSFRLEDEEACLKRRQKFHFLNKKFRTELEVSNTEMGNSASCLHRGTTYLQQERQVANSGCRANDSVKSKLVQ